MSAANSYGVKPLNVTQINDYFDNHQQKYGKSEFMDNLRAAALRGCSSGPESEAVSLLRDILLLPANEQQLEYLHRGSGTATHFAVLLRAEKFLHSLGATPQHTKEDV
jgi:hypothetical protein